MLVLSKKMESEHKMNTMVAKGGGIPIETDVSSLKLMAEFPRLENSYLPPPPWLLSSLVNILFEWRQSVW